MKLIEKQQIILFLIVIVMLLGLAYELMYIEGILRGAVLSPEKECQEFCNELGVVMYFSDGQCFCKEPVVFDEILYCIYNATVSKESPFRINTTEVRNLAVASVVQYSQPNAPATKVFAIYNSVAGRLKYVSDPRKDDYIADPKETWDVQGGDCDDASILLASMYEAIGLDAKIAEVWNETYGHVFVLVKIEEDPDIFMKSYEILMNKDTVFFGPKHINFVLFAENEDQCRLAESEFNEGRVFDDLYITVDSNALGYAGYDNPLKDFRDRAIFEVGES